MSNANADRNCITQQIRSDREAEERKANEAYEEAMRQDRAKQAERKARPGACQSCGALASAGESCESAFGPD